MNDPKASGPIFSVVVCTYNRAQLLSSCLESLTQLALPRGGMEVVIIDNNSTDSTQEVCRHFCTSNKNFRSVVESEQGLSVARNRGIIESTGLYLAYLDDECKVAPDWLIIAEDIAEAYAPAMFGGPYEPWYESPKPFWYKDAYGAKRNIAGSGWLEQEQYLSGGNMFIDASIFEKVGFFLKTLGMKGAEVGYGEETEFQARLREGGGLIYYDQRLLVWHCVRREKMSALWRLRVSWRIGEQVAIIQGVRPEHSARLMHLRVAFRKSLLFLTSFAKALVVRDRVAYPSLKNFVFEVLSPCARAVSYNLRRARIGRSDNAKR